MPTAKIHVPSRISRWSRNTSARPNGRRSARSAPSDGRSRRRKSPKPSTTWRRNCWRSRPSARRSAASPSARTRTGSGSSRNRSRTRRRPTRSPPSARSRTTCGAYRHGPAALRRRRLRQDRTGHAGGLQGRRGRQAGCRARADDRPVRAARPHLHRALCRFPLHRSKSSTASRPPRQAKDILARAREGRSISSSARTGCSATTSTSRTWAC